MSDVKLRPCPFCGKQPSIARGGPAGIVWYVECNRGEHTVLIQNSDTRAEAIAAWNTRSESPVEKAAGEMREVLQAVKLASEEHILYPHNLGTVIIAYATRINTALAAYDAVTKPDAGGSNGK